MAYQDEHGERRRIVVETPGERREKVYSEAVRYPERSGMSGAALAAIVVAVIGLAVIIILFAMNRQQQESANANVSQPPQTTIVQQPAQQPPVIVQQPPQASQPPVIVNNPPASGGTTTGGAIKTNNDSAIQAAVDKKLSDDPMLSQLGITAIVLDGKVTLTGLVKTEAQKVQVERAARSVKGVKSVDNQISVGY